MYFMDAVRLLLRRWYVAVIGIVLIAGGAMYTLKTVPTQYQASGEMLFLLPPDSTGAKTPSNPYINLVPGLTTTAALIATESMTTDVAETFADEGYKTEYSVALVPSTGPLLTISTQDTDPAKAVAMRDRVMVWLNERLEERQKAVSVPPTQAIYTENTNVGKEAEVVPGNKLRALAGVGGAGMILTLLVAFVLDRLLSRRQTVAALKLAAVEDEADHEPVVRQADEAPRQPRSAGDPKRQPRPAVDRTTGNDAAKNGVAKNGAAKKARRTSFDRNAPQARRQS